jgi:hypothetical protein
MMELLQGRMAEAERLKLLDEILRRPACREEFELLRAVVRASGESRPVVHSRQFLLPAAAAAVLVIGVATTWWVTAGPRSPVLRGGEVVVEPVAPLGTVSSTGALRLIWHAVPDAWQYQAMVVDMNGHAVYRQTVSDTTVALPDSSWPPQGATYRWWVRASLSNGEVVRSEPTPFGVLDGGR